MLRPPATPPPGRLSKPVVPPAAEDRNLFLAWKGVTCWKEKVVIIIEHTPTNIYTIMLYNIIMYYIA